MFKTLIILRISSSLESKEHILGSRRKTWFILYGLILYGLIPQQSLIHFIRQQKSY